MKNLDKKDFILRSFRRISNKKEELYVITRIFHLLNDLEIEFVCQQKVRKPDGKIYLVDIFFPQFKLYLEVNEAHHLEEGQKLFDKLRMEQIWEITDWERHEIFTNTNLAEINHSIENFISVLRVKKENLKAENSFKRWTINSAEEINQILERGYLHSKLNDHLPKHADVTRLFGANHKEWYKGSYPYSKPFDFIPKMVWFPKLYRHSVWTNQLTEDGSKIIEKKSSGEEIGGERSEEVNKIVFGHYKDPVGKTTYRYMGEFIYSSSESSNFKNVYKLVSESTCLKPFINL